MIWKIQYRSTKLANTQDLVMEARNINLVRPSENNCCKNPILVNLEI